MIMINTERHPDITRTDVDVVLVAESATAPLAPPSRPEGLLSVNTFQRTDGGTTLTYTQWAPGTADHAFVAGLTGADPVEYRLYRSGSREDPPATGCVVVVRVEFDGPDADRQRRWVDTVFAALAAETEPAPGGISAHFHVSTDGTRVLNYAEWTDEQAHRDALERSGRGTIGSGAAWQRVQEFPGVRASGFQRYRLLRSATRDA